MSAFVEWLTAKLKKNGWSNNELARRAGLSSAAVSQVMTGRQNPGVEFCLGVSDALNEAPTRVFRLAGLLPENPDADEVLEDVVFYYARMTPDARQSLRTVARALAQEK
jgi:transcriptional regulator with XRE-family HTH domain